ncbi:MAG: hypothetical protein WCT26_04320 [Candidatus Buchananbacteria bacterium]|jgi:hypothetical protein
MLFLLLRLLPAIIPILFFVSTKAVFYYADSWQWFIAAILLLPTVYFVLLKYKNRDKIVIWLGAFSLIYALTGFAYSLVLENPTVISIYLLGWSLIYALYLEAVFHDFYETAKAYVFNLLNITLYGNILIIFFLTAVLASFNIFLNLSWIVLLVISAAANFLIIYLAFQRQNLPKKLAMIYSGIVDLILTEVLGGLLLLPSSFYVIAIITALCYYLLMQILLSARANKLNRKLLIELLAFSGLIFLAAAVTAAWL